MKTDASYVDLIHKPQIQAKISSLLYELTLEEKWEAYKQLKELLENETKTT